MPVSTERNSGFSISKWELKYLRCRYKAHRNKIASAKPAIDANSPPERPHVSYKKKKALQEERRQMRVVQENFRLLDRTINIMASTDMPSHFSNARSTTTVGGQGSSHDHDNVGIPGEDSGSSPTTQQVEQKVQQKVNRKKSSDKKYYDRPLTARLKRNTHIIFHWFIQRFHNYVPWWAEINY